METERTGTEIFNEDFGTGRRDPTGETAKRGTIRRNHFCSIIIYKHDSGHDDNYILRKV